MGLMWDYENQFSSRQALTAAAVSDNAVKVASPWTGENPDRPMRTQLGSTIPVSLQVVGNGFEGAGTITVAVETSDTENFAVLETVQTNLIPNDRVVKGGPMLAAYLPASGVKAYLRLRYTPAGAIGSAGVISAGLTLGAPNNA